jgi:hypothetical protein
MTPLPVNTARVSISQPERSPYKPLQGPADSRGASTPQRDNDKPTDADTNGNSRSGMPASKPCTQETLEGKDRRPYTSDSRAVDGVDGVTT